MFPNVLNEGETIHFGHVAIDDGHVDVWDGSFEGFETLDAIFPGEDGLGDGLEQSHCGFPTELVVVDHQDAKLGFGRGSVRGRGGAADFFFDWLKMQERCGDGLVEGVSSHDVGKESGQVVLVDGSFEDVGEALLGGDEQLVYRCYR